MERSVLIDCVLNRWSPRIGDPHVTGWLTVLSYLVAALLAAALWRRLRGGGERWFWALLVVILLGLAVNKQLDLQSALTAAGKCLAHAQGWYAQRREVQAVFIVAVAAAAAVLAVLGLWHLRGRVRRNGSALLGMILVLSFVVIRALSFHHFDRFIGLKITGVSVNFLIENIGLWLIAGNAAFRLALRRKCNAQKAPEN